MDEVGDATATITVDGSVASIRTVRKLGLCCEGSYVYVGR